MRQLQNQPVFSQLLPGVAALWHLGQGHHPRIPEAQAVLKLLKPEQLPATLPEGLPLQPFHRGHHVVQDDGYLAAAGQTDCWPLAPMYVRDLAGRILFTGLQPMPKLPEVPLTPETCSPVQPAQPGFSLLENVFLCELRRLELAATPGVALDHVPEARLHALYAAPHRYPYKLRLDSFYQDGFRLPQLQRIHVQAAAPALAQAAADEFIALWEKRPADQEYEQFYEANNGAEWYEALFQQGCTVIPTTEAYNGWYQVTPDYGMADVFPGRAVRGLHEVVGKKPSTLPEGTILSVKSPGYATRKVVVPAQVVVSDGSGWQSSYPDAPHPFLPDLMFPHPRVGGNWGDVWLPTHPAHFVQPSLWDWSTNGHFQQVQGPLWDPVHYVYASTSKILRAIRRAPDGFAPVPEDLKPRFHPLVELVTYDTHNARTMAERHRSLPEDHLLHATAIDALPLGRTVAPRGYHPLPAALEYELDPAAFPELGPARFGPCPAQLAERCLAPISSGVNGSMARQHTVVVTEPEMLLLLNPDLYPENTGKPLEDYPQLCRGQEKPDAMAIARAMPVFLPERDQGELFANVRRLFSRVHYRQQLSAIHPELPANLQAFTEEALSWRRRRYRAWRRFLPGLLDAWWTFASFENALSTAEDEQAPDLRAVILTQQPALKAGGMGGSKHLPPAPNAPRLTANAPTD